MKDERRDKVRPTDMTPLPPLHHTSVISTQVHMQRFFPCLYMPLTAWESKSAYCRQHSQRCNAITEPNLQQFARPMFFHAPIVYNYFNSVTEIRSKTTGQSNSRSIACSFIVLGSLPENRQQEFVLCLPSKIQFHPFIINIINKHTMVFSFPAVRKLSS